MNRFHGEEWPCSPARLFRALLAGSMTGSNRRNQNAVRPALHWLEQQAAPEIHASPAPELTNYRISVPNNDMDVAAWEWANNRVFDTSLLKTLKTVSPRLLSGEGPHLTYCWPDVSVDAATENGLRLAVQSLHTLGWGIDMAFADLGVGGSERLGSHVRWAATDFGTQTLAVPTEGSLDDLEATYQRFLGSVTKTGVNPDTRPTVYRWQGYSNGTVPFQIIIFELGALSKDGEEKNDRVKSYPPEDGMIIAAWLRHASAEALREERYSEQQINELALGHDMAEVNADRIIYIPLPSIGFEHANGRIRRVMIAFRGKNEAMDLLERKLNGWTLTDTAGEPVCRLVTPSDKKVRKFYLEAKREWATVTPVILHGYNAAKGTVSLKKTDKLLAQAFQQAGHDVTNIEEWAIQPAPFWPKTPGARSARVPKHLERWPRYHVWVRFKEKIRGPVLAGIGRHYGFGVFGGLD